MIPTPEPLPDELISGHLGRLLILNGVPEENRNLRYFADLTRQGRRGNMYIEKLATLARQPLERYVFHHTLTPFKRAIQAGPSQSWLLDPLQINFISRVARKSYDCTARLCPECINEDLDFWGFSYWRRAHQLPGVIWCNKHMCSLFVTHIDTPVTHLPENALHKATSIAPELSEQALCSPAIQRYGEICIDLLEQSRSFSTHDLVQTLQIQARRKNLLSCLSVGGAHLNELATEKIGGPWLTAFFPEQHRTGRTSSLARTYSSLKTAYPTLYYALALALLFESSDEAISALVSQGEPSLHTKAPPSQIATPRTTSSAVEDFLAGMPLEHARQKHGLTMPALEKLLRQELAPALQ